MKNKILFFLITGAFLCTIVSCRKGEKDPFLSLTPRNVRLLKGEWILTKGEMKSVRDLNPTQNYTVSFSNDLLTVMHPNNPGADTSMLYSMKLDFNKKGKFTYTVEMAQNINFMEDYWSWQKTEKGKTFLQAPISGRFILGGSLWRVVGLSSEKLYLEHSKTDVASSAMNDLYHEEVFLEFEKK
ncbi:MAG: hypothetical protein HND27_10685 [Bacteroidetes bacterium]|nr:hypothetical protein [Bacteroidota bacterium]MCL4817451.1 hypothetical protein [Flavobacteriales bacterium]NOG96227.1 hypothetical protein [Bacteroidota bacterium]GIK70035.1 MAG: hypothetical protein BroJett020_13300 [Bacteroidota bacterium]CAG0994091.1 hypothetical protein FLAV_02473 [Flavobacteriales bacterium]